MSRKARWRVIHRIKDHIRTARTVPDVNAAAVHYARFVVILSKSRRKWEKTMAEQIKNLAAYRRKCIREGWG